MTEANYKSKRKSNVRKCVVCDALIYFKINSVFKWVPFNELDDRCHYEDCSLKPRPDAKTDASLQQFIT